MAYAAADDEPEPQDEAKFEGRAFEVGNNSYLERAAAEAGASVDGDDERAGEAADVGSWSLPVHIWRQAGLPSQGAYYGRWWVDCVRKRAESPITVESDTARLQIVDAATGATRPLTKSPVPEGNPILSPDVLWSCMDLHATENEGNRGRSGLRQWLAASG